MLKMISSAALIALASAGAAQETTRAIIPVTGDVYRWQNNFHFGLVVITSDGIVVADPIGPDAATWLEAELSKMSDLPVTHLVYSHSHGDHASGGAVFADTAEVIALDRAPEEIDGVAIETRVADGAVMEIGGKTLEFTDLGPGHGADLMVMTVRPENVAFVVDAVSPRRLPWRDLGGADIDQWIGQVKAVQGIDFDILAPGHGNLGDKASVDEVLVYMEMLRAEVLAGLQAGKTVADLQTELTFDAYADWQGYEDWRTLNIEGTAAALRASGAVN